MEDAKTFTKVIYNRTVFLFLLLFGGIFLKILLLFEFAEIKYDLNFKLPICVNMINKLEYLFLGFFGSTAPY